MPPLGANHFVAKLKRCVDHIGKTAKSICELFSGPCQEDRQWPFSSERGEHGEQPDACRRMTETCIEGRC